jgi:hypothetical protein
MLQAVRGLLSAWDVNRGLALLAAAAAGVALSELLRRMGGWIDPPPVADMTDPSIPPSENSATPFRDKPEFAQEDADQE